MVEGSWGGGLYSEAGAAQSVLSCFYVCLQSVSQPISILNILLPSVKGYTAADLFMMSTHRGDMMHVWLHSPKHTKWFPKKAVLCRFEQMLLNYE